MIGLKLKKYVIILGKITYIRSYKHNSGGIATLFAADLAPMAVMG